MLLMEKIPGQTGYLLLSMDGAVLESGGELSNKERIANTIITLVEIANRLDSAGNAPGYNKISINYDNFSYVICLSKKRIYVVKKQRTDSAADMSNRPVDM